MAYKDSWYFRRGILWSAQPGKLNTTSLAAHVPAQFHRIEKDSLAHLLTAVSQLDPIAPEAIAKRFEMGGQCFVVQVNGAIAAYGWVTRGPEYVGEFERQLQVREGEAYIWDCATLPDYRRQRLFCSLLAYITGQLQREGIRHIWIIGLNAALAINKCVAAIGFQPVMGLTYFRLFNKRVLIFTPLQEVTPQQLVSARRLLKGKEEREFGRLLVGNSSRPRPPDTHFDG